MNIKGFPSNIDINPREPRELGFTKDFLDYKSGVKLNVDTLTLVREAHQALIDWIETQYGLYENPPMTITTDSGTILPYYMDLNSVDIGLYDAQVGVDMRKSFGHFFENADVLTFEVIANQLQPYIKQCPFLVEPADLKAQRAITTISSLLLVYQLYHAILEVARAVGLFFDPTALIAAIVNAAAAAVFLTLTIVSIINAVNTLRDLYYPKINYIKAVSDYDLISVGCQKLGYTFQSDLLGTQLRNMSTIGIPIADDNQSIFDQLDGDFTGFQNKGYPTAQDTTPTLGSLIDFVINTFNARCFVFGGVVRIEPKSYFINSASIKLKPTKTDQENSDDRYIYNQAEAWGRRYDHWQTDFSDLHSVDKSGGMRSEYITEPVNTLNPDLVRLIGLKENSAPFALARRKIGFNGVEEFVNGLFKLAENVVNSIVEQIQKIPKVGANANKVDFTSGVQARIGVMIFEHRYFSTTKKVWLYNDNGDYKQTADYQYKLSMDRIYNTYKTDLEVKNNTYKEKTMRVPFTDSMFTSLLQNNFVEYEPTGDKVEVVDITWFDKKNYAEIKILLPSNAGFNTKTTKLA